MARKRRQPGDRLEQVLDTAVSAVIGFGCAIGAFFELGIVAGLMVTGIAVWFTANAWIEGS